MNVPFYYATYIKFIEIYFFLFRKHGDEKKNTRDIFHVVR